MALFQLTARHKVPIDNCVQLASFDLKLHVSVDHKRIWHLNAFDRSFLTWLFAPK